MISVYLVVKTWLNSPLCFSTAGFVNRLLFIRCRRSQEVWIIILKYYLSTMLLKKKV